MQFRWAASDSRPELARLAAAGVVGALALRVIGLPPFAIHGPLHRFGVMDPLCGMTRAVRALARGEFAHAWSLNPASFALATAGGLVLLRAVYGAVSGRWLELAVRRIRVLQVTGAVAVTALWINQQLHASMLR